MNENKFAKIFNSKKYGQIVVLKTIDMNGNYAIEYIRNLDEADEDEGLISIIGSFGDCVVSKFRRDMNFREMTTMQAVGVLRRKDSN